MRRSDETARRFGKTTRFLSFRAHLVRNVGVASSPAFWIAPGRKRRRRRRKRRSKTAADVIAVGTGAHLLQVRYEYSRREIARDKSTTSDGPIVSAFTAHALDPLLDERTSPSPSPPLLIRSPFAVPSPLARHGKRDASWETGVAGTEGGRGGRNGRAEGVRSERDLRSAEIRRRRRGMEGGRGRGDRIRIR